MGSTVTPSTAEVDESDQKTSNENNVNSRKSGNVINGLDQMVLEPDNAAEIETLEQSLSTLVDDFRSGRMCACKYSLLLFLLHLIDDMLNLETDLYQILFISDVTCSKKVWCNNKNSQDFKIIVHEF